MLFSISYCNNCFIVIQDMPTVRKNKLLHFSIKVINFKTNSNCLISQLEYEEKYFKNMWKKTLIGYSFELMKKLVSNFKKCTWKISEYFQNSQKTKNSFADARNSKPTFFIKRLVFEK